MRKEKTKNMVLCAMFVSLISAGAWIRIPVPVVPFTLQFLFTTLAGLLLGGERGAMAVGIYMIMGLLGLPVFAEGGGPGYLLRPSFGYLISKLYLGSPIGLWPLFLYGFILAVPGDIVLCLAGAVLGKRLIPLIKSNRM